MSFKVEKIENGTATIKIEVSPEDFEKAIAKAFAKNRNKFKIDGFRKGKVPRQMIEARYGKGVFYEDAIDEAFPEEYLTILESGEVTVASRPYMKSIDEVGNDTGLKMTIEVALLPEVELADYETITVSALKYTPKEKDVKEELEKMQQQNARLISSDKASKKGDTVMIDFEGFVDDIAFEGGKAENYALELGSKSFIDTFEDQLIGKKAEEAVDVKVTFPENYQSADLSGKEALFKVLVREVKTKELPKIDDEFAQEVSEFDTLAELKKDLKATIKTKKEQELRQTAQNLVVENIIERATVVISDLMVDERAEAYKNDLAKQLQSNGIDPNLYFGDGSSEETKDIFEKIKQDAYERIKSEAVVKKMLEKENITVSDEEFEEHIEKYAKLYRVDAEDFKKRIVPERMEAIREEARTAKLLDKLMTYVKVEKPATAKKEPAAETKEQSDEETKE